MPSLVNTHRDLRVYQRAFKSAMSIYVRTKEPTFPKEERYALGDQIRRSSRSVCANLAEAWRKRRYQAAFIAKLSDAEAEAAETVVWIEFALECKIFAKEAESLLDEYDHILAELVKMIDASDRWLVKK